MKSFFAILFFILVFVHAKTQVHLSSGQIGGPGSNTQTFAMAIDYLGNILVTGHFTGSADFDPDTSVTNLLGNNGADLFILKLNPSGKFIWAKAIAGPGEDKGYSIAVDSANNVFITGIFTDTVDFDPGPGISNLYGAGFEDAFVLKLYSNGNFAWAKSIGTSVFESGTSICVDSKGVSFTAGKFRGTTDFDPSASIENRTSAGQDDNFILKLDSAGNYLDVFVFGNTQSDVPWVIKLDKQKNIVCTGDFKSTCDFDPGLGIYNLTATGGVETYILKLDTLGNFISASSFGGPSTDFVRGMSFDEMNNIYLTGSHFGITDFDPGPGTFNVSSLGFLAMYILKLDFNGEFLWAKSFTGGGPFECYGEEVAIDSLGFVYVTGVFSDTVDFDPGPGTYNLIANGNFGAFVQKLDPNGNLIWVYSNDGIFTEYAHAISIDKGKLITTGSFQEVIDLDPGTNVISYDDIGAWDGYIQILALDTCSYFGLMIDSLTNRTCQSSGFSSGMAFNGTRPYSYYWNTVPILYDSVAIFYYPGIFTLHTNDVSGCERERMVVIHGPTIIDSTDLQINLISTTIRPGAHTYIWLDGFNHGCDTVSGFIKLILDTLVNYDSATVVPNSISGDTLVWTFSALNYDSLHIKPVIFVTTDTLAAAGDTACFEVIINPLIKDVDTTNNHRTYCFPVMNGYDPNDKQVYPLGECPERYIEKDETITYTIRFQNTGNAEAINIFILDTINENLDFSSILILGSSHQMLVEAHADNVLKFRFDNIYLPDSTSDEPNSHGYVIYEVNALPTAPEGIVISNKAEIYFDFNPPIVTNSVWNTLVDTIVACNIMLSNEEYTSIKYNVQVYPNPTNGNVTIKTGTLVAEHIRVSDLSGRTMFSFSPQNTSTDLNLNQIEKGVYLITVTGNGKKETLRLLKQ